MMLAAADAVKRAKANELNTSQSSTYVATYGILVILAALLSGGANLFLEGIMLAMFWVMNSKHDGKDIINRVGLVSAGPLIRINIACAVGLVLLGGANAWGLYPLWMLGFALYYHARRFSSFKELMNARVRPLRKPLEHQSEVDRLEEEAAELKRLKDEREKANALRAEIGQLRAEVGQDKDLISDRLGVLSEIAKAHNLYKRGVYTEREYTQRRQEMVFDFDWTEVDASPELVLGELVELQDQGAIGEEEVNFVKDMIMVARS